MQNLSFCLRTTFGKYPRGSKCATTYKGKIYCSKSPATVQTKSAAVSLISRAEERKVCFFHFGFQCCVVYIHLAVYMLGKNLPEKANPVKSESQYSSAWACYTRQAGITSLLQIYTVYMSLQLSRHTHTQYRYSLLQLLFLSFCWIGALHWSIFIHIPINFNSGFFFFARNIIQMLPYRDELQQCHKKQNIFCWLQLLLLSHSTGF